MTQKDEIEEINRRMRTVPELDQLAGFLSLKQTGEATDVTVKYHTNEDEPMWAELIIKTTPDKKESVMKHIQDWEKQGLI